MCGPVRSGLRHLESFILTPVDGRGLEDEHLVDGLALLTSLTRLEFRGDHDLLTDQVGCVLWVLGSVVCGVDA